MAVATRGNDAELCAAARLHKSNGGNSVGADLTGITKGDLITVDCMTGDVIVLVRAHEVASRERLVAVDAEAEGSKKAAVAEADSKGEVGNGEVSGSSICNAGEKRMSRSNNQSVIKKTSQQQHKAHLKNMRGVNIHG